MDRACVFSEEFVLVDAPLPHLECRSKNSVPKFFTSSTVQPSSTCHLLEVHCFRKASQIASLFFGELRNDDPLNISGTNPRGNEDYGDVRHSLSPAVHSET
jgi:hypothetical protein